MDIKHKTALRKAALFQSINDDDYENLISCISPQIKHHKKNEILLLTGDFVNTIGIVLSGTANAYLEKIDGNRTIMSNLAPMSVYGEILVSTRTHKSPVTIYATTDVTAASIEYTKVCSVCEAACAAHRTFLENLLKAIGDKYFLLFDRINILREKKLRARIITYLHTLSAKCGSGIVSLPFTKTMLAEYLLVNRSALSREMTRMVSDGIIKVSGRTVELLD